MPDNDYGYTSQVVVRQTDDGEDADKIGHVKAGEQEDFVTGYYIDPRGEQDHIGLRRDQALHVQKWRRSCSMIHSDSV
jgi:hypothetical protein